MGKYVRTCDRSFFDPTMFYGFVELQNFMKASADFGQLWDL